MGLVETAAGSLSCCSAAVAAEMAAAIHLAVLVETIAAGSLSCCSAAVADSEILTAAVKLQTTAVAAAKKNNRRD